MDPSGIIVGTLLLWALSFVLVSPMTSILLQRKLAQPAYAHLGDTTLCEEDQALVEVLRSRCYIVADVAVLFAAGLIGGLLGYWFLGIATRSNGWPGMIAFVGASFLGLALRPGVAR